MDCRAEDSSEAGKHCNHLAQLRRPRCSATTLQSYIDAAIALHERNDFQLMSCLLLCHPLQANSKQASERANK